MSARARGLQGRLRINPDAPAEPSAEAPPSPSPPTSPATPQRSRQRPAERPPAVSALDDPAVHPGRKDYRSFYVDDGPYSRFRAAMYWLARNPEVVAEHGDSMSSAAERWLGDTASDLERRFNGGQVFDAPPASRRRTRGK